MRALTFLLVLTAGCRAENATKNATANATGAATSTLVELDEKKPRRRPKKTAEKTLDQLLEQLFEANSVQSAAAATPAQKKKRRKKAKDLDVSDDSESLEAFVNKLLASDKDDKDDAVSKIFGAGDLAGLEAELSKQARELADLLKPTKTKKNSGFRTVEISTEDLAKLFPSANDQKVQVQLGDGQVFTVDFDGDIQKSILQKSKKNPVPTVAAFLESVSGRQTDNFDFPCSTEPCAGVCIVGSGSRYIDGWYARGPCAGEVCTYIQGDVTLSQFTQPSGTSHWFVSNERNPETPSDDVDYLRTIKAGASQKPPEARSAWGIVDRASTVAHAELTEEEARIIASDWPTRAPFVLRAQRGTVCQDALEKLSGEDVPALLDALLDGSAEGLKRVERALSRLAKPESWKSIAATWLLKVLDDGTLEDILDGADAQYREDVLVLAAVGVAVLTAFLMLALWLGRRVLFENVDRPFFDQRENDDILGVAPTPQIGGEGWASESEDDEPREVTFDPVPRTEWRAVLRRFEGHFVVPVALLLLMILREAAATPSQLTSAFVSAYQKHPRVVVALALNASLRFALSVVALTRHIISWVGADDWRGATKAAGDEALWLMAIALARDLRKGEDGLDESLRDAFLGALVAGAVALVAKLCRARAARLALDEPLEASYAAVYKRVRAHLVLLLCVLLLEGFVVGASVYYFRTMETGAFWRYSLPRKLRAAALCARTVSRTTQVFLHVCCTLIFGKDAMLVSALRRPTREAFALEWRFHARAKPSPRRAVASYYCELWCHCIELVVALAWYGYELIRGALEPTAGSVLFSLYAQHAFGKLRAKVAYHREWLQLNTRAKDERALFVPASEAVVERYDDICVICHDNFEVDGARRLRRTTPIKLPRCAHLLHRGCLEVCLENAHRTLRPLVCPICTAPMRRGEAAPEPVVAPGPDLPVVGDFAAAAPEEEVE
ncbi:unnamed protein product [Pelagomonas calceolata]|uniref:RING-type domain-containing protein n=1 Tax=Pelagomonas calceolata TaxID=35677 RepID=A0A7S4EDC8_9STRA|nr:unnamed protein product [Pelagomonas calceolata]